jgi:predicted ATPase
VGKTSVALAVAAQLLAHFVDGAWFIDLAAISDPALVAPTIAGALGVRQTARHPVYESLVEHLGSRRVLLVLDNFEQVLAGALVVADLLASCPGLAVLATSREPLRLRWERRWPVPPLELPALDGRPAVDALANSPAVALFVERARAVSPNFALHEHNASTVAQICIRLDGLPLAIELAAARVKVLSPPLILTRLERRLDLAGQDTQDCPPRHRTLRAAIAWSYDLLDDRQRAVFRRLGVFVGGCTVEAAAAICLPDAGAEGERCILDALASLIDKQLLRHDVQPDGASRFRMLETIREYAQEQLAASCEAKEVRQLHAKYYVAITEEAVEGQSPRANAFSDGLDWEIDNFRATLRWSLAAGDIALGLRLIELLYGRWAMLGLHREGREWLAALLARAPEPTRERAGGLLAAAYLALRQGDYVAATALLDESLTTVTRLGDARRGAQVRVYQGMIAHALGEPAQAMSFYQEGLALLRAAGEQRGLTGVLRNLADLAYEQRELERARARYEETLVAARDTDNRHDEAYAIRGLAHVARLMDDLRRASDLYCESLLLCRRMEDHRCITFCIEGLACVASRAGVAERATVLFGAAQALRETIGVALPPAERADHDREVAAVRRVLDDLHFSAARSGDGA